ncbi:unnamed protein product [Ambrosiozyma monospora]|uniref:Unnamed protein product n=1 Tax=Ambrosiozyma monospora TaxID=43982 RepID=A0ACB5SWI6_AMBMO|nr:unnamed protein product [Ambrosiozyma monospora]
MSESVVEGAKALLKLRRAYHTLDQISQNMERQNGVNGTASGLHNLSLVDGSTTSLASSATTATSASVSTAGGAGGAASGTGVGKFVSVPIPLTEQAKKDAKVIKNLEKLYKLRKSRIDGEHIGNPPISDNLRHNLGFKDKEAANGDASTIDEAHSDAQGYCVEPSTLDRSTIDEYIHSGVKLCFGILQVVLSLIPSGIGKVLSIVGFKGSREGGLKMVWEAAKERNIHGGIALLALLVFYDGPFQFTDVDFDIPSTLEMKDPESLKTTMSSTSPTTAKELSGEKMALERVATIGTSAAEPTLLHPGAKLVATLLHARALFPNSNLWLLQEGRMLASRGRLEEAVQLMDSAKRSQMKQVDALLWFDRCMILVFMHNYERAAKDFIELCNINSYSHALYNWFAGACYLEAYRMCVVGLESDGVDQHKRDWYKAQADKYLHKAPTLIGKKKFFSKIPPFEKFIERKYNEIVRVSTASGVPFLDAVGTSLAHELAYFWNGYNRMSEKDLQLTLKLLGYSASKVKDPEFDLVDPETKKPYAKVAETEEQSMIRYTLQALSLRRLGQIEKGMNLIQTKVIDLIMDPTQPGKMHKLTENPWLYPTALYERALFSWKCHGVDGLDESMMWLKRSAEFNPDDYELSARVSMKTKAAIDRLDDLAF